MDAHELLSIARAHITVGSILYAQGRLDEAAACYEQALAVQPGLAAARLNLGRVLERRGRLDEAAACYEQALAVQPGLAAARYRVARVLRNLGKLERAIAECQHAIKVKPDYRAAVALLVELLELTCQWRQQRELSTQWGGTLRETPHASIRRCPDPRRNLEVARAWAQQLIRLVSAPKGRFSLSRRRVKPRLRIGYLSGDFREHPVARQVTGLLRRHDRARFEVVAYSYGRDDGGRCRSAIQTSCDTFIDLVSMSDRDAAARIYDDEVDILVDLTGWTRASRFEICALRPAPIQVSYLGFPGSTGADFMDYLITDRTATPADEAEFFSEKLVRLPHSWLVFDDSQPAAQPRFRRDDFGLPENAFVFCSLNESRKFEPTMFDCWMRILHQAPSSVLWLYRSNSAVEENLRAEAEARGVDSRRLIFAEEIAYEDNISRLQLADLALETRVFNGGDTTGYALWAGVPVVALYGSHMASRMGASMLRAIGLPEMVAGTLDDYEALAIDLAQDPSRVRSLKNKLRRQLRTEPLFDTARLTRNLEKAYIKMWETFCAGEEPKCIEVSESERRF